MSEVPQSPRPGRTQTWAARGTLGRHLLVLFIAFSLGPLLISNVVGYWVSRSFWLESFVRDTRRLAEAEATKTHDAVSGQLAQVEAMAAGDAYLRSTAASLALELTPSERTALDAKLASHLSARADERSDLTELLVLSPNGTLLASSKPGREAGGRLQDSPCALQRTTDSPLRGLAYGGSEPRMIVARALQTPGGAWLGTLCGLYHFDVHHALVSARHELGGHGNLYLIDHDGRVICGSGREHSELHYGALLPARTRGQLFSDRSWSDRYNLASGEEVISAFVPVADFRWGVLVELPTAAALADLERLKWLAIGLGVLLSVTLTLAILLTSRRLARQLGRLTNAAQRIAGGSLGERIPEAGPSEVAQLAAVFNQMSRAVHDSHADLERRIQQRTRELSESQEFTELLIDSIEQRVLVIDSRLRIIKANRSAFEAYGRDLIGSDYSRRFAGRIHDGRLLVEATLSSGHIGSGEVSEQIEERRDILRVETYPVRSSAGDVASVVEISRVVTQERQTQAQMMHSERMAAFGLLAAGIAHDIGNPIASIQSQLQMARRHPDPQRVEKTLKVVDEEVSRMGRMLRDLVDFTRRRRDAVSRIAVEQVVSDVVRLLSHDPRARNVDIRSDVGANLPGIRAREDDLMQILLNLGINALDAMPAGGTLVFSAAQHAAQVEVRAADSGNGVPAELDGELFDPFVTSKAPGRGTGLGLFVSRAIARELGGDLVLVETSEAGTTFAARFASSDSPPAQEAT